MANGQSAHANKQESNNLIQRITRILLTIRPIHTTNLTVASAYAKIQAFVAVPGFYY